MPRTAAFAFHPSATFPDLLRAELAARDLTTEQAGASAEISGRTLRDHLAGKHPLPGAGHLCATNGALRIPRCGHPRLIH